MTGKQTQVIPGIYRQHILAGVIIAGHQPVGIDTHGGGSGAEGSHITVPARPHAAMDTSALVRLPSS